MGGVVISTVRDAIEFVRAKRLRKEPIIRRGHVVAEADYYPKDLAGFARVRRLLHARDFAAAVDRLDAIEYSLIRRHRCALPLPRKIMQNSDASLSVWWEGAMVRLFPHGMLSMIGGPAGKKAKVVTSELLDLLAFQVKIQRQGNCRCNG